MTAFARGKKGNKSIYVPTRGGGLVQRSTGTANPQVVRAMKRMVVQLADEKRWVILDAIRENRPWTPPGASEPRRLTLADVYGYYTSNAIALLESLLTAHNLCAYLDGWISWVRAEKGETGTAELYRQQVESLTGTTSFLAAELTSERVMKWLTGIDATTGTRRKYYYALRSFMRYLFDVGVLTTDPLSTFRPPKKNPSRLRWETIDTDRRIVDAALPKYRAFFAFVKATGADVGPALKGVRRDLDLERGTAHVRGTKTGTRNRHEVEIESWALPILREHCRGMHPNAPLFPELTKDGASQHHLRLCGLLEIEDYTLRDARHSVAVRGRKRGKSLEWVAAQLGHKNVYMAATIYAVFTPTIEERLAEGVAR